MRKIFATLAALFFATAAFAQNPGSVPAGAYALGRGPGVSGYSSLLCTAGQLAVGQAGSPVCRTVSGDWTLNAAGVATLATVNSNVGAFGSATQSVVFTVNAKGLITAAANVTVTPAIGSVTGLGAGCATFLGTPSSANLRGCLTDESGTGLALFQSGDLGTPSAGVITNLTGTCTSCTANAFTAGNASNLSSGTVAVARGGVDQTAYTTWSPTVSCGAGTITTLGTVVARYKQFGKVVIFYISITITTNGTCASSITATLPFASASFANQIAQGREDGVSGKGLAARVAVSSANLVITNYDNTYPGANGAVVDVSGQYEVP